MPYFPTRLFLALFLPPLYFFYFLTLQLLVINLNPPTRSIFLLFTPFKQSPCFSTLLPPSQSFPHPFPVILIYIFLRQLNAYFPTRSLFLVPLFLPPSFLRVLSLPFYYLLIIFILLQHVPFTFYYSLVTFSFFLLFLFPRPSSYATLPFPSFSFPFPFPVIRICNSLEHNTYFPIPLSFLSKLPSSYFFSYLTNLYLFIIFILLRVSSSFSLPSCDTFLFPSFSSPPSLICDPALSLFFPFPFQLLSFSIAPSD